MREKLLRTPAVLYWAGLHRHGICHANGSIARYHASLDTFYATTRRRRSEGDESELIDAGPTNWHPGIPHPRTTSGSGRRLRLTPAEADYLRERFVTSTPGSYLAWALLDPVRVSEVDAPWSHPSLARAPRQLREVVEVARRFSLLMFGAVLVYNLAMAERSRQSGLRDGALADEYRSAYAGWTDRILAEIDTSVDAWDRSELWAASRA